MNAEQPAPTTNDGTPIWELVIADMKWRDHLGRQRYGTPLQAHNGRDALEDLTQELLDAVVYTRQLKEEMKCLGNDLRRLLILLAGSSSQGQPVPANAVSLLESVLRRNPALGHAGQEAGREEILQSRGGGL